MKITTKTKIACLIFLLSGFPLQGFATQAPSNKPQTLAPGVLPLHSPVAPLNRFAPPAHYLAISTQYFESTRAFLGKGKE